MLWYKSAKEEESQKHDDDILFPTYLLPLHHTKRKFCRSFLYQKILEVVREDKRQAHISMTPLFFIQG